MRLKAKRATYDRELIHSILVRMKARRSARPRSDDQLQLGTPLCPTGDHLS
jgi:hypothetical protein